MTGPIRGAGHVGSRGGWLRRSLAACLLLTVAVVEGQAQQVGRQAAEGLRFSELRFDPPEPVIHDVAGVQVHMVEDATLPLVHVVARFRGGYGHFGRENFAAGTALPGLMRGGGTASLSADSVERVLDFYALQTGFGGSGNSTFASVNTLRAHLDEALAIWGEMLKRPGFDTVRTEVWRGQELENVLRRRDDPGRLAFSTFNRLMFGDHPIGWDLTAADLAPDRLSRDRLLTMHARVFCRDNLALGVTGDVSWSELRPRLERLLADWPACDEPLPEWPTPHIRREPGVFLIPLDLEQSTVVLAHATDLRQGDTRAFFASRIGNAVLGASGLSSRLMRRIRSEEGLAYSASSLWTAPVRHDGLVGATTRTRADATVATIETILEELAEVRAAPPTRNEVQTAVDEATNGFVFNFESAAQVVSRSMFYSTAGLPADWLSRYLAGIQRVRPQDVHTAFRRHLDLDQMVILVVGDPERFDAPLEGLGPVTLLDTEGMEREPGESAGGAATSRPSGWQPPPA
jgi:predicted Zn-dependent peptidase